VTVLVLTELVDPTADRVIDLLNGRGVPVFRCDTGWFPQHLAVEAELVGGQWFGQFTTRHRQVELVPHRLTDPQTWIKAEAVR
jgi:hypothetical protein